jgi:GNAT superfamily N-acetyltransferase
MDITTYDHSDGYTISTDPTRLQIDVIHGFLSNESYWGQGRLIETVRESIANSLCFGLYHENQQVGFARVVTDGVTFAWLCDVFILPDQRGKDLGKWLIQTVVSHPRLKNLRRMILATRDAHGLYQEYGGFSLLQQPELWMERFNPDFR